MDLLMESNWTGQATYQRAAGVRPFPRFDFNSSPALVQELTDSFNFFDGNGDGRISKDELAAVVRSLGQGNVSDEDLDKLMNDVDVNGDGYVDLYEFIDLNTRPIEECPMEMATEMEKRGHASNKLLSAFNVFDVDGNGFISAEELHRVLVGLGDESVSLDDCRCMIKCVDEDGDDKVDLTEFEALMSGPCVL